MEGGGPALAFRAFGRSMTIIAHEERIRRVTAPSKTLLADLLGSALSENAREHLRRARVVRHPEHAVAPESLRAMLLLRGMPGFDAVVDLEARAGGAVLPDGRIVGAGGLLRACPWMRPRDLPRLDGAPLIPVLGLHGGLTEDMEVPVHAMDALGAVAFYAAPSEPIRAYASFEHFLELLALAPFSKSLHTLRIDALCAEEVAGLVGALPHAKAMGEYTKGYVGNDAWVKEELAELHGRAAPFATFLLTERLDLVAEVAALLLEEGRSLGHRGPTTEGDLDAEKVLSFVDAHPDVGYLAHAEVTIARNRAGLFLSRRVRLGKASS